MKLLKELCSIHGPSGDELAVRDFIINYVNKNSKEWKVKPEMFYGDNFQNCLILKFGEPRTAIFSHMDSTGFTVRYEDQLIPIGSPSVESGDILVGADDLGPIECKVQVDEKKRVKYKFGRPIQSGTQLVFKCDFVETEDTIQSCYLDNRLGIYTMLKLAEKLEDGFIVFSCWEEHGGGSVPFLNKFLYESYGIRKMLIADITWASDGIKPSEGVVVSLRDYNIPRRQFLKEILEIVYTSKLPYQLEVENHGSSDGREIQHSPYPVDWCFIGIAEEDGHSPRELVSRHDIHTMIKMYELLMRTL